MTYPLGKDPLEEKPCETCPDYATNCAVGCTREGDGHNSDCATHNAPAYQKGECDCSAQDDVTQHNPWRAHIYAVKLMYARDNGKRSVVDAVAMPINDVVDLMPPEQLDWAMQQVQASLDKMHNAITQGREHSERPAGAEG